MKSRCWKRCSKINQPPLGVPSCLAAWQKDESPHWVEPLYSMNHQSQEIMWLLITLQLNGGTFLGFPALSQTAAPRTIELFWVSHQNNTYNLQPFHFTSSHLHVGSTFDVLFFPVQVLTEAPHPLPNHHPQWRQSPPPCSSAISFKLLNCAKLPQFWNIFSEGRWK